MKGRPSPRQVRGRQMWCVEWNDAHGTRRHKFFETRAEAQAHQLVVNAMPGPQRHPALGDPRMKLREYGAHWLEANRPTWAARTHAQHAALLEQHVYPFRVGTKLFRDVSL